MNRNVREILNRIGEVSNEELCNTKENFIKGLITSENYTNKILSYVFRNYLLGLVNHYHNNIVGKVLPHLPYLKPEIVIQELNNVAITSKNLVDFINWYFEGFVSFYLESENKETYKRETLELIQCSDDVLAKESFHVGKKSLKLQEEHFFDSYFEIANRMFKNKKQGIFYSEQYECLLSLGMSPELKEKLILGNSDKTKGKEESKKKAPKEKQTYTVVVQDKKGTIEKTAEEKEVNERKRKLFAELEKYYDKTTCSNKLIIEGEDLKRVITILNDLYSSEETANIKTLIFNNNKIMKQEKIEHAKEVLFTEENLLYFQYVTAIAFNEDSRFIAYMPLISKARNEILYMLEEFINLAKEEQEVLKEAYQEQIQLSLEILKEYGLSLPEDFKLKR